MAEIKEQVVGAVEKAMNEHAARIETAVSEVTKLQSKGLAQASALASGFIDDATRIAREQMGFAEQLGSEWRKMVLASAKSATELFSSAKV